jgi:hypothetical protein
VLDHVLQADIHVTLPLGVHELSQRKLCKPVLGVECVSPSHLCSALRGLEPPRSTCVSAKTIEGARPSAMPGFIKPRGRLVTF